VPQFFLYQECN